MIIEGKGKASIKLRDALRRFAEQQVNKIPTGKISVGISRVELVKRDTSGKVIARIVDGDNG
jgi:hypothetical protein